MNTKKAFLFVIFISFIIIFIGFISIPQFQNDKNDNKIKNNLYHSINNDNNVNKEYEESNINSNNHNSNHNNHNNNNNYNNNDIKSNSNSDGQKNINIKSSSKGQNQNSEKNNKEYFKIKNNYSNNKNRVIDARNRFFNNNNNFDNNSNNNNNIKRNQNNHETEVKNNDIQLKNEIGLKLLKINNNNNNNNDSSSNNSYSNKSSNHFIHNNINNIKQKLPRFNNNNPFNKINNNYNEDLELNIERSNKIKESMKFAWYSYKNEIWGHDDLEIRNNRASYSDWLGGYGVTIIDSLTTLYIMELKEELNDGKIWVDELLLNKSSSEVSAFEANIRYLGGLLGIYDLTGERVYLDKAVEFGDLLMFSFSEQDPFPASFLNIKTKKTRNRDGHCVTLAPIGTFSLEFTRLSDLTGDPKYKEKIDGIIKSLTKMKPKIEGLYPCSIRRDGSDFCSDLVSVGGMGDSFYEYLLKMWIYTDGEEEQYSKLFQTSADSIIQHLYRETNAGHGFIGNRNARGLLLKQEHLTCFAGGMFALAAASNITGNDEKNEIYMYVGKKVTSTCAQSYFESPVGLGPESFGFDLLSGNIKYNELNWYLLRPETIESIFILYRLTGDRIYQDWAWRIYESIENNCKVDKGYIGYRDILLNSRDTIQHSFFLAETLKYLYLIFSDPNTIPLDRYVFNTEAHPLLIKYKN